MAGPVVIGVDSGASGAVAFLSLAGDLLYVCDMPADEVEIGGKKRRRTSAPELAGLLRGLPSGSHLFQEMPTARPARGTNKVTGQAELRATGAAGMLAFGESVGIVRGVAAGLGLAFTGVRPGIWKRAVACPAGKDDARRRAQEAFPAFSGKFTRKKDDGRAEASLIALYGSRVLKGERNG